MRKGLVGLSVLALVAACAINPVTGKKELSLISEKQEIELGKQTDAEVRSEYGVYADPALEAYVAAEGTALAARSHRPNLVYHFAVLDTPVVNAFAAPGGYIFITRGLLALVSSEDELAVVLGHEIGHVNARHSVKRLSEQILVQAGLALGSALSETFAKFSGVAGVGTQLLFLKYSRDDERQADALGVEYSRRAGYDPRSLVTFFAAMQKSGDLSGKSTIPGFLATHPLTADRIRDISAQMKPEDARLAHNPDAYLQKIQNLVYGDDPRQGFVEGRAFYHPELGFQFAVPAGWKVLNSPAMVQMTSADGTAALVLKGEKSADPPKDYGRKKAAEIKNCRLNDEREQRVNGLASFEQWLTITQQDESRVDARLSYIRKGEMIYTFLALAASEKFPGVDDTFQSTIRSFRELTDPAYLSRREQRLALVRADGATSLREIFRRQGMAEDLWPQFAIMNGGEPATVPAPGRLIKVLK